MNNPYGSYLQGREPLGALGETVPRLRELWKSIFPAAVERPYAPGKWTAQQIVMHLAQVEIITGTRLRQALTLDEYTVQPFDQDDWMRREPLADAALVYEAFCAMRAWNLALWRSLDSAERAKTFTHPEQGERTISWLLEWLAGHDLNHLPQLEQIAALEPARASTLEVKATDLRRPD